MTNANQTQTPDERVHLSRACREIIPDYYGQPISPLTATRWINRGLKKPDGHRVKLKAFRVGRQLVTSRRWIAEFFEQLSAATDHSPESTSDAELAILDARVKAAGLI